MQQRCEGEFWTVNRDISRVFGLNFIESEKGGGLSKRPNTIRLGGSTSGGGGNSGYQAVNLALHFGASRVILLGYDMQFSGKRKHWHPDHGGKMHNPDQRLMDGWVRRFAELAKEATATIINCTRETALTCFPRQALETALGE